MKIKHFITLALIAFTFFYCEKDNVLAPEADVPALETLPDLSKGITPYLTAEEKAFFQPSELKELNQLVKFPEAQLDFRSGTVVEVPADSEDALAEAILEAGEGGTVILKAGMHTESSTVVIPYTMTLRGEEGAILEIDNQTVEQTGFVDPGIYVIEADNVRILGLQLQSKAETGGVGILLQNSHNALITQNELSKFQAGVSVNYSNNSRILFNKVVTSTAWATGEVGFSAGIVVSNGNNSRIIGNDCSSSIFGVFGSDVRGFVLANQLHQNVYGLILCKVPAEGVTTPDGQSLNAENSAKNWLAVYNNAEQNVSAGYLVIDGANVNYLNNNFAQNNGAYDIELAGETDRFGFTAPTSFSNRIFVRAGQTVKDCGDNNFVRGGIAIDISEDPCM
jgi:hypothetical protein